MTTPSTHPGVSSTPDHGALLYRDDDEYLAAVVPFVRDGLAADEAVLANLDAEKAALVRGALGEDAQAVRFEDVRTLGANPARLLPALLRFAAEETGRRFRVVGEPVWGGRRAAELAECDLHEALLDRALRDLAPGPILCPYDVGALPARAVEDAWRTHGAVISGGRVHRGAVRHGGAERIFRRPLATPPERSTSVSFDRTDLAGVRRLVAAHAVTAGLDPVRTEDLLLAVTEAAGNSVRHGGGRGTVTCWVEGDGLVVDVADAGRIDDPLVGRSEPPRHRTGGRGLWIMNQVCDLVQVRSPAQGTTVRLHMWR